MINDIDFENTKCIVEYGPGTGAFTEKVLARVKEDTVIILVEINKEFYKILKDLYGHKKNVIILNESAKDIKKILESNSIIKVDYIISGLPFASLPKEISDSILSNTSDVLGDDGEFITLGLALMKRQEMNILRLLIIRV